MIDYKLTKLITYRLVKPFHLAIITFGTEKKKNNHRFTNNLQSLQRVMVKDFSWNIITIPWNALLFKKH